MRDRGTASLLRGARSQRSTQRSPALRRHSHVEHGGVADERDAEVRALAHDGVLDAAREAVPDDRPVAAVDCNGTLTEGFDLFTEPKLCVTPSCVSSADSKIPKHK